MKKISIIPKKIKFNYYIILIFLLFSISFILADGETIGNSTVTIKIDITEIDENGESTIIVKAVNDEYGINQEQSKTFVINSSNSTLLKKDFDFTFLIIESQSSVPYNLILCLEDKGNCEIDKAKINSGYTTCVVAKDKCLNEYEGENATICEDELDVCNLNIQQKDIEISGKQTTIQNLEEETEDTENSKWLYAIIALVIGFVVCLFYTGKIGKGAVKDKSMDEFNKSQVG